MHIPRALLLVALLLPLPFRNGTGKEPKTPVLLMWWNVENLFDTKDDPSTADEEFTPEGRLHWTEKKLLLKRLRIRTVLNAIRTNPRYGRHPDIIAFAECENHQVFAGTLTVAGLGYYRLAYREGPDPRGIEIGLAWNPGSVTLRSMRHYRVELERWKTREVVVAGFTAGGKTFHVVLNHWPSRSFDAGWSERNRIAAAKVARHVVDSLRTMRADAAIVVMGDFNDPPESRSVRDVLGSSYDRKLVREGGNRLLYNCWNDVPSGGSYLYREEWEQIDQILVSSPLLGVGKHTLAPHAFGTFSFPHMFDGRQLYSTYQKRRYRGGYSDHLPLLLKIGGSD